MNWTFLEEIELVLFPFTIISQFTIYLQFKVGKKREILLGIITFFIFLQISYAFVSDDMNDKTQFPFFYRMLPKEGIQYAGIIKLLQHFRWTSVALVAPETDNGEKFLKTLTPLLAKNSICRGSQWCKLSHLA